MARGKTAISRRIGRFKGDRWAVLILALVALALGGRAWLREHPQHNPWAPLDLRDPPGWATAAKLSALKGDTPACRAVLERSEIAFTALKPQGEGSCARPDRTVLGTYPLSPARRPATCDVALALTLWKRDSLDAEAEAIFNTEIARIEHLGTYSCRRLYGRSEGAWSEHATGNAIDIAGFVLADGTRISVLEDWNGAERKARFLRRVRDGACQSFSTVLSPNYNAAHRDHFHLDMARGWSGACR